MTPYDYDMRLRFKSKISLEQAKSKITVYGVFGEHSYSPRPTNGAEVCGLLRSMGANPDRMAEDCRNYKKAVPVFENLVRGGWDVHVYEGGKVGVVDNLTNETIVELEKSGKIDPSTYLAKFDAACAARDRAVENSSFQDCQNAITQGVASIEAFLNEEARRWNRKNLEDLLLDSKKDKISLDDKIDSWVPIITGGSKIVKNDQQWNDFVKLRRVRDNYAIHPKQDAQAITYEELGKLIDAFRFGIAGLLGRLHLVFGRPVSASLINAFYMPEVVMVEYTK